MSAALRLDDVTVTLEDRRIVDGVDLVVDEGSWVTVAGANGAGKTTLLRAMCGLQPVEGRVEVGGLPLDGMSRRVRARAVALVPQTAVVPPGLAVRAYVLLGRTAHLPVLGRESRADLDAVDEVLDQLDLTDFGARTLETLSGGELQRVVLARAVAQRAPLLLLDEPTSALDVGHQQDVLDLVDTLRARLGLTVISTMHDLTLTAQYSERVVLLDGGRVAAEGTPADVLTGDRLSALYDARVDVLRHRGALVIVPHRGGVVTPSPTTGPPATSAVADPTQQTEPTDRTDPDPESGRPEGATAMTDDRDAATVPTEDPRPAELRRAPSLVLVNTGDGKGKSSAAMGVMLRSVARGWKVGVVQFLKSGAWNTGEAKIGKQLGVDWWTIGEGFTWDSEDLSEDEAVARSAWSRAREVIAAGDHRCVILDEITYPMNWGWIDIDDVVAAIRDRPSHVNVVCTGRSAPAPLVEVADTVTEMRPVKHAYQQGIRAMKGIDY